MPKVVIMLSDNDISRAYHALVVAISAKALGDDVYLFATGLGAYVFSKRPKTRLIGLPFFTSLFIKWKLKKMGAKKLEELARNCLEMGVRVYVDEPVTKILGVEPLEGVEIAGSLTFLKLAKEAEVVLTF
ncbi:MAG: DsrE family protein [Pyrobaculum sp.]